MTEGPRPDPAALDLLASLRLAAREAEELALRALAGWTLHSAILARRTLGRVRGLHARWTAAQAELVRHWTEAEETDPRAAARRDAQRADPLAGLDADVGVWAEASRSMHALCADRGLAYLHLLQPTLHDEGSKELTPEERAAGIDARGIDPRIRAGYERLRARGAELRALGVDFVDLTQVFADVPETLYYDRCHVNRAGNRILAQELARLIAERVQ